MSISYSKNDANINVMLNGTALDGLWIAYNQNPGTAHHMLTARFKESDERNKKESIVAFGNKHDIEEAFTNLNEQLKEQQKSRSSFKKVGQIKI